ncbi:MAG: hypothetical protein J6K98_05405 [Clostridia bacterium]|nr:hypothetical protein [Clostridia bacterium]
MAREWALAGVPEDELQAPPPLKQPDTPKGKWENFWYHYKWVVLGSLAGAIVLIVLIVQMLNRDDSDYYLSLVTDNPVKQTQIDALKAELTKYAEDVDGDGKIEINIQNLYINPKDNAGAAQMAYTNSQNLTVHMAAGDRLFYIFEDETYKERIQPLLSEGATFFAPVQSTAEGLAEGGSCWDWNGSALQQSEVFKGAPAHLYFGVRSASGTAEKQSEMFAREMKLLCAFVEAQTQTTE